MLLLVLLPATVLLLLNSTATFMLTCTGDITAAAYSTYTPYALATANRWMIAPCE
jgi:hypothetical protein